jgi:serine/threonine protein kinase
MIDFGTCAIDGKQKCDGERLNEPTAWIAPELRSGQPPSAACDVYSLGWIALQCVTGLNDFEVGCERNSGHDVRLLLMRERVSDGLSALLHRMCSEEPMDRPTLADVLAELKQLGWMD